MAANIQTVSPEREHQIESSKKLMKMIHTARKYRIDLYMRNIPTDNDRNNDEIETIYQVRTVSTDDQYEEMKMRSKALLSTIQEWFNQKKISYMTIDEWTRKQQVEYKDR